MSIAVTKNIEIKGANTHNLKQVDLIIPHHQLIVVTGVSGSGKSSLVFDVIAQEGQRRFFETMPTFARQFLGRLNSPDVNHISGLAPVISIGQHTSGGNARSTVGTLSDLHDLFRLLFARAGVAAPDVQLSKALFSFNSDVGKCLTCQGVGLEEEIDLNKLIAYPEKSIRDGALAPTLPNGYVMYSQVTVEVLNQVCESEGFNVDIPWVDLTADQQKVVLYGSDKIKVPFGKHSLESRLKWTGIKAKPREEGFYKGMIPIMTDILRRDRNANILKYVHAKTCRSCKGHRLNQEALSVRIQDRNIADLEAMELQSLHSFLKGEQWSPIAEPIVTQILSQLDLLLDLGLGYLTLNRSSNTLRSSEIQRIRLANQLNNPLSDLLYIFDEPSIGLHPEENIQLIQHFKRLVQKGNTVIVVEHDLETIRNADYIIEMGPQAGEKGGEVLFSGPLKSFYKASGIKDVSPTFIALNQQNNQLQKKHVSEQGAITLKACTTRNLKNINVAFKLGALNVVSGKSGSGKRSLVLETLRPLVLQHLGQKKEACLEVESYTNLESIKNLVYIDHKPIGRTPRSNPATYLGISDHIRDLFAKQPAAKALNYTKSRFSFNNKGGRCETCQGAGKTQVGMHYLGSIDLLCETCNGQRFNEATLEVKIHGLNIADCYQLSVDQALDFFKEEKKICAGLKILQELGLGYLSLGQSSTTLSGGEAQRIKIANQLQKKDEGNTLYIIEEPSIGLHHQNNQSLLRLFDRIKANGNTIVCIEQEEQVIQYADWHIDLGPEGGDLGGQVVYEGVPKPEDKFQYKLEEMYPQEDLSTIQLYGVKTHGLKNIDITIPKNQLTVVTGLSGTGKSSLVFDTLFAEAQSRFVSALSTYQRSFIQQNNQAILDGFKGLGPAIAIQRKGSGGNSRSTVGTLSGAFEMIRLLYSRIAQQKGLPYTAQHFSYNHLLGACPTCQGRGGVPVCNPEELIKNPKVSIFEGALSENKALAYYADPNGQFMATLRTAANEYNWDLNLPWNALNEDLKHKILYGLGDQLWQVEWTYVTKGRSGVQKLEAPWLGFCNYIDAEYQRKLHNKNLIHLEALLHEESCKTCLGGRLKPELQELHFLSKSIHDLSNISIGELSEWFESNKNLKDIFAKSLMDKIYPDIQKILNTLIGLGLDHLSLNRSVKTLSGGEIQRLALAKQLSAELHGVIYVLDEPTIGLDAGQVKVLMELLRKIMDKGNTVVVVEHDLDFISQGDYIIELGPEAGVNGGHLIYQGNSIQIHQEKQSVTQKLLGFKSEIKNKSIHTPGYPFGIKGASAFHLKNIDVQFYTGQITAITGVSGSGKSSLIDHVLYPSWLKQKPIACEAIYGFEHFESVIKIDQSLWHQSRLQTPASYTGVLKTLQKLFGVEAKAQNRGLKNADFSYQSTRGKCKKCGGYGAIKTAMDYMSDLWLTCDVCMGLRYDDAVLNCKLQGLNIGQVLQMSVNEIFLWTNDENLLDQLQLLQSIGLGHLILGQEGSSLSLGEGQRLKLAVAMMQKRKGNSLYIFDEPSTGLHYFDLLKLQELFEKIVKEGDSIIYIEHHQSMLSFADQVITLGPGSGEKGGGIINNV